MLNGSFTYGYYRDLLASLQAQNYRCVDFFSETPAAPKSLLLRHDLDIDVFSAKRLAEIEREAGYRSTWFIQPNNDFYNPLSAQCLSIFHELYGAGHTLGLHVDPSLARDCDGLRELLFAMHAYYSRFIPLSKVFSFHRPAAFQCALDVDVEGFVNAYEARFYKAMAYVSDSNRREFWKEPRLEDAVAAGGPLYLLTHALWWGEEERAPSAVAADIGRLAAQKLAGYALRHNISIYKDLQE